MLIAGKVAFTNVVTIYVMMNTNVTIIYPLKNRYTYCCSSLVFSTNDPTAVTVSCMCFVDMPNIPNLSYHCDIPRNSLR